MPLAKGNLLGLDMASKCESVMILSGFSPSAGATQMISLELSEDFQHTSCYIPCKTNIQVSASCYKAAVILANFLQELERIYGIRNDLAIKTQRTYDLQEYARFNDFRLQDLAIATSIMQPCMHMHYINITSF